MKIATKMNFLNFKYLHIHDKIVVDCGIDIQWNHYGGLVAGEEIGSLQLI